MSSWIGDFFPAHAKSRVRQELTSSIRETHNSNGKIIPRNKAELHKHYDWVERIEYFLVDNLDPDRPIEFFGRIFEFVENFKFLEPKDTDAHLLLSLVSTFLRKLIRIRPRDSLDVKSNTHILNELESLKHMEGPKIPDEEFLFELCKKEEGITLSMERAISRFFEGIFRATIEKRKFVKIKNSTDRKSGRLSNKDKNKIFDGFEMIYTILDGCYIE